jgi:hypothetical protein
MKNPFIYLFAAFMSVVSLASCSSDDDKPVSSSREIKYEVTGTTSAADMSVTYTTNGGGTSADVTSLPWTYTFTADSDTFAGGFSFSASDAEPGEKVTLNVYQGDTKLESIEGTANGDGIIVATISATFN